MKRLCVVLWIAVAVTAGGAQAADLNAAQLDRYHALTAELRCLICQNRSIAESDAPLAKDLRAIVSNQIAAGRSDTQIKQYLVDRYGKWVLYDPPFDWSTWLLWTGPFVLLFIGLCIVALTMRRKRGVPAGASARPLDRERLARVLAEHESARAAGDKDES